MEMAPIFRTSSHMASWSSEYGEPTGRVFRASQCCDTESGPKESLQSLSHREHAGTLPDGEYFHKKITSGRAGPHTSFILYQFCSLSCATLQKKPAAAFWHCYRFRDSTRVRGTPVFVGGSILSSPSTHLVSDFGSTLSAGSALVSPLCVHSLRWWYRQVRTLQRTVDFAREPVKKPMYGLEDLPRLPSAHR